MRSIEALKRGDRVLVLWHDACRVSDDPDVRPKYYSTPKESQGVVFDCVPDPEYPNVFYLILWGETTSGRPDYYDAIPIAWIARIQTLAAGPVKFSRKAEKRRFEHVIERTMVFRRGRLVEDSGGVSKIALRFERHAEPVKLVEEIHKVIK